MSSIPSYHVGDQVVYPNHGVGTVEQIGERAEAGGGPFYLLRIHANNVRIFVPFQNASRVGLRPVSRAEETRRVLEFLRQPEAAASPDWKTRFRENAERMRSGSLLELAEVVKDLAVVHRAKPLSYRERKMFDHALELLVNELGTAELITLPVATARLESALAQAQLRLPAPEI